MTRVEVREREAWRRPIIAHAEDTYAPDRAHERFERSVVFYITSDVDEARERFLRAEVCPTCLEVFPAPPSKHTVGRFREVYGDKPEPIGSRWWGRVVAGCCPICGCEVSVEMAQAMYRGTEDLTLRDE